MGLHSICLSHSKFNVLNIHLFYLFKLTRPSEKSRLGKGRILFYTERVCYFLLLEFYVTGRKTPSSLFCHEFLKHLWGLTGL